MTADKAFRYQNFFLIILSISIWIFYYGESYNYFGLTTTYKPKLVVLIEYKLYELGVLEKSAEKILEDVGWGRINPERIKLKPQQKKEIQIIISKNPENYNDGQKQLIYGKSGNQILTEVDIGTTDPKTVKLTQKQFNEIKQLINNNSNNYSAAQKSLLYSTVENKVEH